MNRIFTIMLVVLFSSNVFADDVELENRSIEDVVYNSVYTSIYLEDGTKGYLLSCTGFGRCYAMAGELCQSKGYLSIHKESIRINANIFEDTWVIKCNE